MPVPIFVPAPPNSLLGSVIAPPIPLPIAVKILLGTVLNPPIALPINLPIPRRFTPASNASEVAPPIDSHAPPPIRLE